MATPRKQVSLSITLEVTLDMHEDFLQATLDSGTAPFVCVAHGSQVALKYLGRSKVADAKVECVQVLDVE